MITHAQIIEAGLNQLHSFSQMKMEEFSDPNLVPYTQHLIRAKTGHIEKAQLSDYFNEEAPFLVELITLHQQLLDDCIDGHLIKEVIEHSQNYPNWQGEALFVSAVAMTHLRNFVEARDIFNQAILSLNAISANRKALLASVLQLHCRDCLYPTGNLKFELRKSLKMAQKSADPYAAAVLELISARICHRQSQYRQALQLVSGSTDKLVHFGNSIFLEFAHLHRAYLHYALGERELARKALLEVKDSHFFAIVRSQKVIDAFLQANVPHQVFNREIRSIPQWDRDVQYDIKDIDKLVRPALSRMESKLVQTLLEQPLNRKELTAKIYGTTLNAETSENRLKNLLSRLRRKYPEMIESKDGFYQVDPMRMDGIDL